MSFFYTSKYYIKSEIIELFYMIAKTLTELYLRHFNQLHGALCICWHTAFCYTTKQLDLNKLKEQIRSHGIYSHENAIKVEVPFIVKEKPLFKTLTWVNDYTVEENSDNIFKEYDELYEQALKEVRDNLLTITEKSAQITYANFILHDFDRSFYPIQTVSESKQNIKCKEFFEFVLNRQFIADNDQSITSPKYSLSIRLFNHLDFIDKLIEIFSYSDIDLLALSKKHKHNLYLFDENKIIESVESVFESSNGSEYIEKCSYIFQNNILPKFNSTLSDDCLIKIMHYITNKKLLENPNTDTWLFWFNRKYIKVPAPLKWIGSNTMLSNIIQHLCGESNSITIKTAFGAKEFVKPTRKEYESGRTYKEIEQIITVSKQKK
jgi:hypothetical protein